MKMKRDAVTGIVGLTGSLIWLIMIQYQTKQPANLLEPGPRLLPYVSFFIVAFSSLMLLIKGLRDWKKDPHPDKPYFPKGGILKVTKSYAMLVIYGIVMTFVGFLISTPFACFAFIYDLKGKAADGGTHLSGRDVWPLCNVCLWIPGESADRNPV